MRTFLTLLCLTALIGFSCSPSISGKLSELKPGQTLIKYQDGQFSEPMSAGDAFAKLKSNEAIYFAPGRVILNDPLNLDGLDNIKLIGNKTSLVAKIDMPIVNIDNVDGLEMVDLLVVHEIGEWCAQNCVELHTVSNLKVSKCNFDGSGYFGLALTKVKDATIENNKFYNCEYGLAAWSCQNLLVKNNEFAGNRGEDIQTGDKSQFANDVDADNTFIPEVDTKEY